MSSPNPPFSTRATEVYRGWDALAVQLYPGSGRDKPETVIIDTDAAPPLDNVPVFNDMREVRRAINDLLLDPDLAAQAPLVEARLRASQMLLRVTVGREEIGFQEYVETLMGITPERIPEDELDAEREAIEDSFRQQGLSFDAGGQQLFEKRFGRITDPKAIEETFRGCVAVASAAIAGPSGMQALSIPASAIAEDRAWIGRFRTIHGDPYTLINTHARHVWTPSKIPSVGYHETAHAAHFAIVKLAIEAGRVDPFIGVTTVHSPEQIHLEAVAQLTEQIMLRRLGSWEATSEAMRTRYRTRVYQNAHYDINTWPYTADNTQAIEDYVKTRLPFEPLANIQGSLQERRLDPVRRAYSYCYAPALVLVDAILEMPATEQNRRLGQLYQFLGMAAEVAAIASSH